MDACLLHSEGRSLSRRRDRQTLSQNILLFGNRSLKSVCIAANMSGSLRININILLATHGPRGLGLISCRMFKVGNKVVTSVRLTSPGLLDKFWSVVS